MIVLMIYALLVAALLGLAALLAEKSLGELQRPRRFVWMLALAASIALPLYALLAPPPAAPADGATIAATFDLFPALVPSEIRAVVAGSAAGSWLTAIDWRGLLDRQGLDAALGLFWIASSILLLLALALSALGLARRLRRADQATIDEQPVVLSDRLGPAVVGFLQPRIVLPRWLADAESDLRSLVLRHEREHLAARDQLALLGALLLVAAMPWNPVLWWQFRRLRAAIEVDCDARVLGAGADRFDYAEALLAVKRQAGGVPLGAVALTEPASELERRIGIMLGKARRFSMQRTCVRLSLIAVIAGCVWAVEAPRAQQAERGPADPSPARDSSPAWPVVPILRKETYERLEEAQKCMDAEDLVCARAQLDQVWAQADLNSYERANYWLFSAALAMKLGDLGLAMRANEYALDEPNLPTGLRMQATGNLVALYADANQYKEAYERLVELRGLERTVGPTLPPAGESRGEYLPIVKVAPVYPPRAAAQGLEGSVIVRYTVMKDGTTSDIVVIESTSPEFEQAAIESAQKYKYRPRIIDGTPVEVAGVTTKIIFDLE